MFNNLIKWSSGRTTSKVLATLLVITLTFANFALLGTFMLESIAIENKLDEQNVNTNSDNVKFNVYFDKDDNTVREVSKNINSEDLILYASVSVEGNGKLEKGIIDFSNSNFQAKENEKVFKKGIDTISNDEVVIEIPIVSRKDSEFSLSLLSMISQIKLTGEYIDENGSSTKVESTKEVKINWKSDEIKEKQIDIAQEVITNKIYSVEGKNKRVLQLLVKTKIKDNKVPVKSTKLEIENPIIGVAPETVKVSTYNTAATNGGSSIEFNNSLGSKWNYNKDENKTYIELTNNASEDGKVSWKKDATDELIVTFIYDEKTEITTFESNVKTIVEVYGSDNKAIEKQNNFKLEKVEEKGNIINIQSAVTKNIYKGYMYLGQDTEYKTKYDVFVSYAMQNGICLVDFGDTADTENLATYYKSTLINKAQAINVLGNEGTIKIYNGEKLDAPISEIVLSQENNEEYFTINYSENINNIVILTSEAKKEGKIEIINEKAIKVKKLEGIEEATKLDVATDLYVIDSNKQKIENTVKNAIANLLEPKTSIDVVINNKKEVAISNQVENELTVLAILNANNNSNKLFENPTIEIALPKEITDVTLNKIDLLYEDELKVKPSEIRTNEDGSKTIVITLEGKQTKYNTSDAQKGANIVMDLKVKANPFMADKNVEVKATCINGEEKTEDKQNLKIESKKGLVTKSRLIVGTEKVEKINENNLNAAIKDNTNVNINSTIINNFNEEISNVNIIGNIPEKATLANSVISKTEGIEILYSEDLTNWKKEVTDYSKIKAFKIQLNKMAQASLIDLDYNLNVNIENLELNETLVSDLNIEFKINEQAKKDTITFILNKEDNGPKYEKNTENLKIEVASSVGGKNIGEGAQINNGQVIRYTVKVTNTSKETINNLNIKATKQNGVFYDLVRCGAVFDESKDENGNLIYPDGKPVYAYDEDKNKEYKEFKVSKLEPNQTSKFEYLVVAYIGQGENAKQFNTNIAIKADDIQEVNISDIKSIVEAKIALKLKYGFNEETTAYSGSNMNFRIEVKNLSDKEIQNVNARMVLPKELDCDVKNQSFLEDNNVLSKSGNEVSLLFKKLNPNETKTIDVEFITNELPINEIKKDIKLNLIGTISDEEKEYISNDYTRTILQSKTKITTSLLSDKIDQVLKVGDEITYIVNIKNDGYIDSKIIINDFMQKELKVTGVRIIDNNEDERDANYNITENEDCNLLSISEKLEKQKSMIVKIKAKIDLEESRATKITNKVFIVAGVNNTFETNELVNELMNPDGIYEGDLDNDNDDDHNPDKPEDPEKPDNPDKPEDPEDPDKPDQPDDPQQPDIPEDPEGKYTISGCAWLDENKNGIRDNKEETLKVLEVILLDSKGKEVATTTTSLSGTYQFNNLEKGEYVVVFKYNTEKYAVTKYQVQTADETNNSDVISKTIELNNEKTMVGITDVIKLNNKDITNIDIGLVENPIFDLSLNKYISKVVVTTKDGTTTYNYDKEELAKVEIAAKKISGSVLLIEYGIEISNEGDITGYVTDIVDYLPEKLEFNSEINTQWYLNTDNNLHFMELEPQEIEPGKIKVAKLVLTKTLKSDSVGTIENVAEILDSGNIEAIDDIDSIAGNKKAGEDDIGNASLIISVKTGSTIMYIGIVIACMAILGLGIYIINKKVLKQII